MSADERKWRTESDLETLKRAAEINNDRARLAAVQKAATAQANALKKLAGSAPRKGK